MKGVVVVTGGTKGLGREISLAFGRAGYLVAACYASDTAAAEETRALLEADGGQIRLIRQDVAALQADAFSELPLADAPRLILVNNACASFSPQPFHQLGAADFQRQFEAGALGAVNVCRALLRPLLRQPGNVVMNVLTTAVPGLPPKGFAAYAVAKHALRGLTLALAAEYAARGLKVCSISPGFMDTPLTQAWDERLRAGMMATPGQVSQPHAVASRMLALAEDLALPGQGEDYRA
jgi:3-oxoacyl-[acyl-carrier protein] reductase